MSIDGIGKPSGITPGASAGAAAPASSAFELGAAEGTPAAESTAGGEALRALERGEIDVEQYLDARVEGALSPLIAKLSPQQLDFVRGELRAALETDPVLVELVRKATGVAVGG